MLHLLRHAAAVPVQAAAANRSTPVGLLRPKFILAAIVAGALVWSGRANACGITWKVPVNHFDGVEEHGYVAYSEQIGELDLGKDLKFPLIVDFNSARDTVSPIFGQGFLFTLLDSNIVQVDEKTFVMMMPDGWRLRFKRSHDSEDILNGQGTWKAKINGNVIEAYATCGWKLTYTKGKITAISTPKGRRLDFIYRDGHITEVQEGGFTRLQVTYDGKTGLADSLQFNGKKIGIQQAQRPNVQVILGQNVVGGFSSALSELTPDEGPARKFEFGTNDKIQPTLRINTKIGVDRLFTWNPVNRRITADGIWNYDIKPGDGPFENAAISRTNDKGQSEYWFLNKKTREEVSIGLDGVKRVTSRFASGKLRGKLREIKEIANGVTRIIQTCSYDENGTMIRDTINNVQLVRDEDKVTFIKNNNNILFIKINK